jgi:hypothetical protein
VLKRVNVVKPDNVEPAKSIVYELDRLPAVAVYTNSDEVESTISDAPRQVKRVLEVIVEVAVAEDSDSKSADTLDELCELIEDRLSSDEQLTGGDSASFVSDDFVLERIDIDQEAEQVERPVHTARMVWLAIYTSYLPRDRRFQSQNDFENIHAEWLIGHDNDEPDMAEADRAEDDIELEQP